MDFYITKINWEIKGTWLSDYLKSAKDWNYIVSVKAQNKSEQRSLAQNRFYHAIKTLSAVEIWISVEAMHEYYKDAFLSIQVKSSKDKRKRFKIPWSTKNLTTSEFKVFMDKVIMFCNDKLWMKITNTDDEDKMIYYAEQMEKEARNNWSYYLFN